MINILLNYIRLGRPYYVMPAVAFALAGYMRYGIDQNSVLVAVMLCIVFLLLGMSCWAMNEIADIDSDARGKSNYKWGLYISGGTGTLPSGIISVKSATIYVVLLSLSGLALAATLGLKGLLLSTLFLTLGIAYSFKPLRFKTRGILGLATVAIAYGVIAFLTGRIVGSGTLTSDTLIFSVILTVAVFGFEGVAQLIDHSQDMLNGEKTLSVSLGPQKARLVIALCQCIPAIIVMLLSNNSQPILKGVNIQFLIPLLIISVVASICTATGWSTSNIKIIRLLGVPLLSAFAFLIT